MAIPCGINTLQQQSFVECPENSGQVARAVKVCNPEDFGSSFLPDGIEAVNEFNEIASVAVSSETDVLSYTVSAGKKVSVSNIEVSGDNIATYRIKLNNVTIAKKRTYIGGSPNEDFTFFNYELAEGDVLKVTVVNRSLRNVAGNFEARISGIIGDV